MNLNSHDLTVKGNWINEIGPAAFIEGTGSVTFAGDAVQTCFGENFHTLSIDKSAGTLIIPQNTITECEHYDWVQGGFTVNGGTLIVYDLIDNGMFGDITLNSGSLGYQQNSDASIDLRGNLTIHAGNFTILGGISPCYFTYSGASSLTMDGGTLDIVNAGIRISDAWPFTENISGGTIRTSLGLEILRDDFTPTGSTFEMYGPADCALSVAAGSHLYNLLINKSTPSRQNAAKKSDANSLSSRNLLTRSNGVTASGTLQINGDFILQAGSFTAPASMKVKGNWSNEIGQTAFIEGTGTVEFNGFADQYCTSETFNGFLINKLLGSVLIGGFSNVICQYYTWNSGALEVVSGSFTAHDLTQNGIFGSFTANSGCVINLTQDAGHSINLNGALINHTGVIYIHGGGGDSQLAYNSDAEITMDGGMIDFQDHGIVANVSENLVNVTITDGTLQVWGGFADATGNIHFDGGKLSLLGSGSAALSLGMGSYLYNLVINKTGGNAADNIITAQGTLMLGGYLTLTAGLLDVSGCYIQIASDVNIYGTLKMTGSGNLEVRGSISWFDNSISNINAGSISCGENWLFEPLCNVNLTGSSTMFVSQFGGTINNQSTTAKFGDLKVFGLGMSPTLQYQFAAITDTLRVEGTLMVNNYNSLNLNGGRAVIKGATTLNLTSAIIFGNNGIVFFKNNVSTRGKLEIGNGTALINGTYTSFDSATLNIGSGTFVNDVANTGVVNEIRGAITMTEGLLEFTNNSVAFKTNATRVFSGGIVRVGGGFAADESNSFPQSGGKVELTGSLNGQISMLGGGYFSNLYISKSSLSTMTLSSAIDIRGNFTLHTGNLNSNSQSISLYGLWLNEVGPSAFTEGLGTVNFIGNLLLTGVSSTETFNDLTINNSADFFYNFRVLTNKILTVSNNLQITDGTLNLQTGTSLVVGNNVTIASGAGLNAYYGGNSSISITRNLNDNNLTSGDATGLYMGYSTLSFVGSPISTVIMSEAALETGYLIINKGLSSGVYFSKPVKVAMNCNITAGFWNDSMNGYTHEFRGNFTMGTTASFNLSNANTLSFKGDSNQIFTNNGTNSIYALTVDKSALSSLTLGSNLIGLNGGLVTVNAGLLNIGQRYYRTTGNVVVNNTGKISIGADGWLEIANAKALTVNNGGVVELLGTNGHNAKLTRQMGNYDVNVESGGTISAEYATFEYMGLNGINLKAGSLVDPVHSFNYCTFQNGKASGVLLLINNAQSIIVNSAVFPTNTWSGTNNVAKTADSGSVYFYRATGAFSGATYESDAYNRIIWSDNAPDLPPVSNLSIQILNGQAHLAWDYELPVYRFNVYKDTNPNGDFQVLAGYSNSNQFDDSSAGTQWFYLVKAERLLP